MRDYISDNRFNPLWLITFYWVCRLQTKKKAAKELKVDQGTVTYRIRELGKAWGEELIKPTRWVGCRITPFGKWLYRYAKLEYLAHEEQKKARVKRLSFLESQEEKDENQ